LFSVSVISFVFFWVFVCSCCLFVLLVCSGSGFLAFCSVAGGDLYVSSYLDFFAGGVLFVLVVSGFWRSCVSLFVFCIVIGALSVYLFFDASPSRIRSRVLNDRGQASP